MVVDISYIFFFLIPLYYTQNNLCHDWTIFKKVVCAKNLQFNINNYINRFVNA